MAEWPRDEPSTLLRCVIPVDKDPSNMREAGGDYEKPKEVPGVGQRKRSKGSLQKWTGKSVRPLRLSELS